MIRDAKEYENQILVGGAGRGGGWTVGLRLDKVGDKT